MPELDELTRALDADLVAVRWHSPAQVRARGDRRSRTSRLVGVGLAGCLLAGSVLAVTLGPGDGRPATALPAGPVVDESGLLAAMLDAHLVGTGFGPVPDGDPDHPGAPMPLAACRDDALLAAYTDGVQATVSYVSSTQDGRFDERITAYPHLDVARLVRQLPDRIADACPDTYDRHAADADDQVALILQQHPDGQGVFEVFIPVGGYLVWLRIVTPVDYLSAAGNSAVVLTERARQKAQCVVLGVGC